ncbi:hypothetical protein ACOMHN_020741 [Nucella lapillus]
MQLNARNLYITIPGTTRSGLRSQLSDEDARESELLFNGQEYTMSFDLLLDHPALVFRVNDNGGGPELLRQVFLERGWSEFDGDSQYDYEWNLWWRTSRFRTSDYNTVYPWQRLNHYPKSTLITKKDALARNLKRMQCVHGNNVFNFVPVSFNLPNDYTKYVKVYESMRQKGDQKTSFWICKPADLSRGRGIFIFRDLSDLLYDFNAVVQQYIDNPLLIGGYKSDLRIYVAVTSFQPLKVYVHEEGIVRFSTEKFDLSSTKNIFAHLTNTSINKHSPGYTEDKERVGPGCKWTLTELRRYFLSNNINDHMLWRRIVNIVILTILVQAPQVQKVENCFELYGFDILVDENLKPWLLEVNFSPSLSSDCQVDVLAKKPMLHDLMDLLHLTPADAERGGEPFHHYFQMLATSQAGLPPKRGSTQRGVGGGHRRNEKPRAQGRRTNRVPSGRTESRVHRGSGEKVSGLTPSGGKSGSQEDVADREGRRRGEAGISRSGKKMMEEGGQKYTSYGETTVTVDGASKHDGDVTQDGASDPMSSQPLTEPDQASFPAPFSKHHSKTTVSADSHNSGGSEDSKVSKVSGDSGIGGTSRSAGNSAQAAHRHTFSSLPEMSSPQCAGSSIKRRDSGFGKELSLHLPSLENSASSRQSKNSVLSPHRVLCNPSEQPEGSGVQSGHYGSQIHKTVSSKSLGPRQEKGTSRWQQHQENKPSLTHRSTASTVSSLTGFRTGSRLSTNYRNPPPSSLLHLLHHHHHYPAPSRLMPGHPHHQPRFVPQNKTAPPQASFSQLNRRMGNFFLVFPFNEATNKVAATLDAKVIIRETQNSLKEALNAVSNSRSGSGHDGDDSNYGRQNEHVWAPLKVPAEET